jgi:hypothetical protein
MMIDSSPRVACAGVNFVRPIQTNRFFWKIGVTGPGHAGASLAVEAMADIHNGWLACDEDPELATQACRGSCHAHPSNSTMCAALMSRLVATIFTTKSYCNDRISGTTLGVSPFECARWNSHRPLAPLVPNRGRPNRGGRGALGGRGGRTWAPPSAEPHPLRVVRVLRDLRDKWNRGMRTGRKFDQRLSLHKVSLSRRRQRERHPLFMQVARRDMTWHHLP